MSRYSVAILLLVLAATVWYGNNLDRDSADPVARVSPASVPADQVPLGSVLAAAPAPIAANSTHTSSAGEPTAPRRVAASSPAQGRPAEMNVPVAVEASRVSSSLAVGDSYGETETSTDVALTVRLSGLRLEGTINLALFQQPESFPDREKAAQLQSAKPTAANTELVLPELPPGIYAIAVFQDLNSDGILNRGAFGIPLEPYGFSNNARGKFGPPSFKEACFEFSDGINAVEITLK